jgi:dCMP deaminase
MSYKWDERFMELAEHVSHWSRDPKTQVGAVIVNDKKQVLGIGYNGFPRGVTDYEERYLDRSQKLMFVAHAERNALDNCFTDTEGATLYSTLYPCNECAKGIIQKGIKRVVTPSKPDDNRHGFDFAEQMFKEAGVYVFTV